MPIDWFTVISQILNFLVLIWILKRFLYKPVLQAIAQRQARVQNALVEAASVKGIAAAALAKLEDERRVLADGRETSMREAQAAAEAERQRLIQDARVEFDADRERWRNALEREQADFQRELANQAHSEVISIADKLLRDLADTDLQERILEKFLHMITDLGAEEKAKLQASPHDPATIRSAFALSQERRDSITVCVRELLGEQAPLVFETQPSLGCGIEFRVDGHKIAWTLEDYLRSLDTWVRDLIAHQQRQHA